jgi:predicted kinase
MPAKLECIILIGLPAAGKSTFYKDRFGESHVHISKDLWPNTSSRDSLQQKMLEEMLASGRSVVIDNTNPTVAERGRLIRTAQDQDARVIGYFFDVSTRAAVARNATRTGRSKVPNVAIFTTAKRLQPPKLREGFDQLFRIEISEDRSLRITGVSE